ncbi:hypothetical protein SAMN05660835_00477 [Desulfurella multipotens]|uniref:Uncharacterized protein n=1 Tax=Desulfurella multipotens TaxID=79269 RepID=A0A1G6JTN4_9BACT|nr:hypothetical protein SAMN05660835_00477 [Desulfurella multipotens]
MPTLSFSFSKSTIATGVFSLPVPAVVGIAIKGLSGPGMVLPRPVGGAT